MRSYPNKQTRKAAGKVVYPTQTKTRMKGQKGKAAREVRCPQSPAIRRSSKEEEKNHYSDSHCDHGACSERNTILLFFCRQHYATLHVHVCSLNQKTGVSGVRIQEN